jgi:SAM-dependent methyltransferase
MLIKLKKVALKLIKPKFFYTSRFLLGNANCLDIGLDNNSYLEFKLLFPNTRYVGVDFKDVKESLKIGDKFLKLNLENQSLLKHFERESFDLIIVNHVIEHISNGEILLADLIKLLRKDGILYMEFPNIKTTYIRSFKQYQFHDDLTHKRFYDLLILANIALENNCKIISSGPVSTFLKTLLSIPRAILSLLTRGHVGAELIFLQRKVDHLFIIKVEV